MLAIYILLTRFTRLHYADCEHLVSHLGLLPLLWGKLQDISRNVIMVMVMNNAKFEYNVSIQSFIFRIYTFVTNLSPVPPRPNSAIPSDLFSSWWIQLAICESHVSFSSFMSAEATLD